VRLTVILAAILFLIGISSHFPVRAARYGLIATACVLLAVSLAQLATLPGPPP
jgi:NADH:ubiquinone oxidoreductase subunit K